MAPAPSARAGGATAGAIGGRMWYVQATCNWLTLAGVISVSGEKRIPLASWPYVGHSFDATAAAGEPDCAAATQPATVNRTAVAVRRAISNRLVSIFSPSNTC